jgi:dihydrofolate synthase/folylpolyglutamate synthase
LNEKIAVSRSRKTLFTNFKLKYLNQLTGEYCRKNQIVWETLSLESDSKFNYFEENQQMAKELFSFLEPQKMKNGPADYPHFKGRREEMTFKGNTLIFIGAHNIDGIRRMIELFSAQDSQIIPSKVLLSFSKRPSNEIEVMLKTLDDFFRGKSELLVTSFVHPKAFDLKDIEIINAKFNKINKGMFDFVTDWKKELNLSKNQNILVCGSYYFVGEVQRFILSNL